MPFADVAAYVLAVLFVFVGLGGIFVPALPGTILVWGGLTLAAWTDGFVRVGVGTVGALGVLAAISYAIEFGAAALGARRFGASRQAVMGAAIGMIVGMFFGLPGILLGPFAGAVLGEYAYRQNLEQAGRVGLGTWIGFALGLAAKLAITFTMIGVFVGAWFFWE